MMPEFRVVKLAEPVTVLVTPAPVRELKALPLATIDVPLTLMESTYPPWLAVKLPL